MSVSANLLYHDIDGNIIGRKFISLGWVSPDIDTLFSIICDNVSYFHTVDHLTISCYPDKKIPLNIFFREDGHYNNITFAERRFKEIYNT